MDYNDVRITKVFAANRIFTLPDITTRRHDRPRFGLMIKSEGETVYKTENGKKAVSDRTHICLLPKGSSYSWKTSGGKCYGIEFDAEFTATEPLVFFVKDNEEILRLYFNLEQALLSGDELSQFKAVSYLYQILLILFEKNVRYSPKSKENLINAGVRLMKSSYFDPDITVVDFAKASGISEVYFRRIYTDVYGTSPIKGLTAIRMKKALELLMADYNSVSAVAETVGYPNPYHFSKAFKQYYGVSPTNYLNGGNIIEIKKGK